MKATLHIALSVESIQNAIRFLNDYRKDVTDMFEDVIEVLVNEGAEVAQAAYAEWAVDAIAEADGLRGSITVSGDMPMIAEFGAGDATLSGGFSNTPSEVRPGSYSETHAQQYSRWGFWLFNGIKYTEVQPHRGLYAAKEYIIQNSTSIAQEAFG